MNKETSICISIAARPGNFGCNFHNAAYKDLNLNWIYIPRKLTESSDLKSLVHSIRTLNFKGCSVSMPHKEKIINYIDNLDESALKIGAVNTIVNDGDNLIGYNTDYYGAKMSLEKNNIDGKNVLMIGAGGVAKAVGLAIKDLGGNLKIANRTYENVLIIAKKLKAEIVPWEKINNISAHLLINATSVGMMNQKEMIVDKNIINNYDTVMDVVIYPAETKLLRTAKDLGKKIIPGTLMCVFQAARQFKLYTGLDAPPSIINKTIESFS